ncbi:hypothetical protein IFO70_02150 [Phormidium tenue FACHB-886]|nr:hypothetical protein [Phormidium tenue FACHB-886]
MSQISVSVLVRSTRNPYLKSGLKSGLKFAFRSGCAFLLVGLTACASTTTVQAVRANPERNWFTTSVRLRGTVGDRAPLIDAQLYQLKDATGTIWVLTQRQDVRSGEPIQIKGQVRFQSIPIKGMEFGEAYIEEEQVEKDNG